VIEQTDQLQQEAQLPKVDEHGVNYHAYADDTQLYLRCVCADTPTAVEKLEHCVTDTNQWMSPNADVGQPS